MADLVTCPDCGGEKRFRVLASIPSDLNVTRGKHLFPCPLCEATGHITAAHSRIISEGRAMRDARVARMQSQRERAAELGIRPEKLNDMEHGRDD